MSYCPDCGTELEPTDSFCHECGTEVNTLGNEPSKPTHSTTESEQQASSQSGTTTHHDDELIKRYSPFENLTVGQNISLGGGVACILGTLLPWVSASVLGTQFTIRGIDRDGIYLLFIGILAIAIILSYWNQRGRRITLVSGLIVTTVCAVYIIDPLAGLDQSQMTLEQERMIESAVNIGIGLYLTALGGIGITYGAVNDILNTSADEEYTKNTSSTNPKVADQINSVASEFGWKNIFVGAGAFIASYVISFLYFGFIDSIINQGFSPIGAIANFPRFVSRTWNIQLFSLVYSHPLGNFGTYPLESVTAIASPLIVGVLISKSQNSSDIRRAFIMGSSLFVGYFPLVLISALITNGTVFIDSPFYFDFFRIALWGILHPVLFSGLGAVLYVVYQSE